MQYPPTFLGFLKAAFDTFILDKRLKPRIPSDEPERNIKDYEGYDPSKNPGKEFWSTQAQQLADRKASEQADAESRMLSDYQMEHRNDADETENENPDEPGRTDGEVITEGIDGSNTEIDSEQDGASDFDSDDFGDGFDADFDSDSGSYD